MKVSFSTASKALLTILIALAGPLCYSQASLQEDFGNAVRLLKAEEFQKSANTFSEILKQATDPQPRKFCFIYRAFSYNGLGDFKNAVRDLDSAIQLDPADLASYIDRGKTKIEAQDFTGAKKDFSYVISRDSTTTQGKAGFFYLGRVAYKEAQFELSIKYYDRLLAVSPDDFEAYFNRGAAKDMIMDPAGSIKDYDKAIELHPDYMEAYANRGVAKINLLTKNGNMHPSKEETSSACFDLKKAKELGDQKVDDMIFALCGQN